MPPDDNESKCREVICLTSADVTGGDNRDDLRIVDDRVEAAALFILVG